jgi:hypothetical protein
MKILGLAALLFLGQFAMASTSDTKWLNVRTNALIDAIGAGEASVDFRVGPHFTLGPSGLYIFFKSTDVPPIAYIANGYGGRINFYLSDAISSSWIVAVSAYSLSIRGNQGTSTGTLSGVAAIGEAGYQWVWGSGFNVALLMGILYTNLTQTLTETSSTGQATTYSVPNSQAGIFYPDFSVGWAF